MLTWRCLIALILKDDSFFSKLKRTRNGIAAFLAIDFLLLPLISFILDNIFEMCAGWLEVGGEAVELTALACRASKHALPMCLCQHLHNAHYTLRLSSDMWNLNI
jgi:hypothetical protein